MIWVWVYLIAGLIIAAGGAVGAFGMGLRPGAMAQMADRKLTIMFVLMPVLYGPVLLLVSLQDLTGRAQGWIGNWARDGKAEPVEHPTEAELRDCYDSMPREDRAGYRRNAELAIKVIDEIDAHERDTAA